MQRSYKRATISSANVQHKNRLKFGIEYIVYVGTIVSKYVIYTYRLGQKCLVI